MRFNIFCSRLRRDHLLRFGALLLALCVITYEGGSAMGQPATTEKSVVEGELPPPIANTPSEVGTAPASSPWPPPAPPMPATAVVPEDLNPLELWQSPVDDSQAEEYEVLLQGPVHEAFAVPTESDPSVGVRVYSEPPPEPIVETRPAEAPGGEGIVWIPGYWSWSDEANKYVWVSGLYRQVPPGRRWVPGNWSENASGYIWISGYWTSTESLNAVVEYLPPPPASIDNGPSVPPPGEDYFWLPGHWQYMAGGYQWRSGFWTPHHEGWVWQPACYLYSPQGFVYVTGYWDVLPLQRGHLYAPILFNTPVYPGPSFVYRPRYSLIDASRLLLHLFIRPGYSQYFYGNYYGPSYASLGYRPWYSSGVNYRSNSQWIRYYDWNYRRSGIDFVGSMQRYDTYFRSIPLQNVLTSRQWDRDRGTAFANSAAYQNRQPARSLDYLVRREVGGKPFQAIETTSQNRSWQQWARDAERGRAPSDISSPRDWEELRRESSQADRSASSRSSRYSPSLDADRGPFDFRDRDDESGRSILESISRGSAARDFLSDPLPRQSGQSDSTGLPGRGGDQSGRSTQAREGFGDVMRDLLRGGVGDSIGRSAPPSAGSGGSIFESSPGRGRGSQLGRSSGGESILQLLPGSGMGRDSNLQSSPGRSGASGPDSSSSGRRGVFDSIFQSSPRRSGSDDSSFRSSPSRGRAERSPFNPGSSGRGNADSRSNSSSQDRGRGRGK